MPVPAAAVAIGAKLMNGEKWEWLTKIGRKDIKSSRHVCQITKYLILTCTMMEWCGGGDALYLNY